MYAVVGGSGAGMVAGPLAPTVNSLARTCSVVRGEVLPLAITIVACVPGGTRIVAWRVPELSVLTLPRATCTLVVLVRSIAVTCASGARSTTSSATA